MKARLRLVRLLIDYWLRQGPLRVTAFIVAPTFALLTATFICVSAFTLTAEQQAEQTFGPYGASTFFAIEVGDLSPGMLAATRQALSKQVPSSHLLLQSDQIRPDAFAKRFVQAPLAVLRFIEDPAINQAFPSRYTLVQGSWPTKPFQVVVSAHMRAALSKQDDFTVLSGRVSLNIVGVVRDSYATDSDLMLAGPGTFESIPKPPARKSFQPVDASAMVLMRSHADLPAVTRALQGVVPRLPAGRGPRPGVLGMNLLTRSHVENTPVQLFGADRYAVSYLPLALVAAAAAALAAAQLRRAAGRRSSQLLAVGIPRVQTVLAQAVAVLMVGALGIALGLTLGWAAAEALRAWLLPRFAPQPLSSSPGFTSATWDLVGLSLAVLVIGAAYPGGRTERGHPGRLLAHVRITPIRWAAAVLLVITGIQASGGTHELVGAYLIVVATLLVTPEALLLALKLLPRKRANLLVVSRIGRADFGRLALAVTVIACCVGLPILLGTQLASRKASDASYSSSRIPAHQIWVTRQGGVGDLQGVSEAITTHVDISAPTPVRTQYRDHAQGKVPASAEFTQPQRTNGSTVVMIVPTVADVGTVIGASLTDAAKATLTTGGVLDFTGAQAPQRFRVHSAEGPVLFTTPPLLTRPYAVRSVIRTQFAGAILTKAARVDGLPIAPPSIYIFPHASQTQIADAVQAAVDAGYDSEFVEYQVAPPATVLPPFAYAFLAAMTFGGFVILLLVMGEQARRLSSYTTRLLAIGFNRRWNLSLLAWQAAIVILVGLPAGLVCGLLGVRLVSGTYRVVQVPTLPILLSILCAVVAAVSSTLVAFWSITGLRYVEVN